MTLITSIKSYGELAINYIGNSYVYCEFFGIAMSLANVLYRIGSISGQFRYRSVYNHLVIHLTMILRNVGNDHQESHFIRARKPRIRGLNIYNIKYAI